LEKNGGITKHSKRGQLELRRKSDQKKYRREEQKIALHFVKRSTGRGLKKKSKKDLLTGGNKKTAKKKWGVLSLSRGPDGGRKRFPLAGKSQPKGGKCHKKKSHRANGLSKRPKES